MTERKSFKREVRARMAKTGERYTTARRQLEAKRPPDPAPELVTSARAVEQATGRSWDAWFVALDDWGARGRPHREIARHLRDELAVGAWWAQAITAGYERSRGLRATHQRADGGYAVGVSKTVAAPVERLFAAVVDPGLRARWLTDGQLAERTVAPPRSARFDWGDGRTRVAFWFTAKGDARSTVGVEHERLADADEAAQAKAAWKARLMRLADVLADEPR